MNTQVDAKVKHTDREEHARSLNRLLARDLTDEEMREVSGGGCSTCVGTGPANKLDEADIQPV